MYECWFDGCCEPTNPGGHAGWGFVIKRNGVTVHERSGYVGHGSGMTNNVAEHKGCERLMRCLISNLGSEGWPKEPVLINGDSKLVIMQLQKRWKAKGGAYFEYFKLGMVALLELQNIVQVSLKWLPRALNARADELSKSGVVDKLDRELNAQFICAIERDARAELR